MTVLVIVGAGDHGRVMADTARAMGLSPAGFVEPGQSAGTSSTAASVDGLPVLGWLDDLPGAHGVLAGADVAFVVAIGDNRRRESAFRRCLERGWRPTALVHPTAILLGSARVADGAQICAGTVVGVAASVGADVIVNTSATIDHDCSIREHAFVGPGARLAGRVTLEPGAYVGLGALVREGCHIGAWAYVAAGAVVIRDVDAGVRVAGVPARQMEQVGLKEKDA